MKSWMSCGQQNNQAYTILERGYYMSTAFHGHNVTMQLNAFSIFTWYQGGEWVQKTAIPI
jgi:hypothetical protein